MRTIILLTFIQLTILGNTARCQDVTPGLPGMAPMKWITIKTTHAPGRIYQFANSDARTYTQQDMYFKAWIPVVMRSRFALALAPHYRTEQLELRGPSDDGMNQLSNWRLRSVGLDLKSCIKLDSTSWLINTASVSRSGNVNAGPNARIPFTYTFSTVYLKKKSMNKEIGFGLMVNKSNSLLVLPVFVYNYDFSSKWGIEMSLPHKIAWRHNLTSSDILYLKTEAVTRTYFINGPNGNSPEAFRRIDVDMGVAYNKQITRFMGAEIFAGYRQNLSTRLPEGLTAVNGSGFAATFEIYIRPPQGLNLKRR